MTLENLVSVNIGIVFVVCLLPRICSCICSFICNKLKKLKLNSWVKNVETKLEQHVPVENEKITITLTSVSKENFVDKLAKSEINFDS